MTPTGTDSPAPVRFRSRRRILLSVVSALAVLPVVGLAGPSPASADIDSLRELHMGSVYWPALGGKITAGQNYDWYSTRYDPTD